MNKLTKIILSITGAGVIMAAGNEALPSAVAMDKVQKAYQSSGQLKEKYKLQDSKFVIEAKDKNKVKVELGETNSAEFEPSLTFSRWEGEAKFKIKPDISKVKKNNKGIEIDGEKIKYKADKKDYVFYDLPATTTEKVGGYELEIVLNSKSDTNVFSDAIESTGVEFYKQKALNEEMHNASTTCTATECKDADGNITASRPDNVVDSIAVYSTGKQGDYTALGGMNYMAGKVAHIYRVKAVDANNDWAWCDQDITDGIWTKTCPQDFLDKAVYPVVIDPTFGYTSVGASSEASAYNYIVGFPTTGTLTDYTITSISAYLSGGSSTAKARLGIWKTSGGALVDYNQTEITGDLGAAGWETDNTAIGATTDVTSYRIGIHRGGTGTKHTAYYDSSGGFWIYATYSSGLPNPLGSVSSGDKYSIYATYTAGGGSTRRIIITE